MSFLKDLFGHHEAENAHKQVYGDDSGNYGANDYQGGGQNDHQSSFTHEAIAGAAGFAALKAYEDHVRRTGEQVSHPMMKEMLAGFAAAEVDKLFETKGLDYLDREKAKRMAVQQAHKLAHDKYGPGQVYQGGDSSGYQGQDYNQGNNYQQGGGNDYQNQGRGQDNYNQGYGGGNSGGGGDYQQGGGNDYQNQGRGQDNYNQGYGGGNSGGGGGGGDYQQNQGNNYNQGQQQQWGGGDDQPAPEHHRHHHHRREEDD